MRPRQPTSRPSTRRAKRYRAPGCVRSSTRSCRWPPPCPTCCRPSSVHASSCRSRATRSTRCTGRDRSRRPIAARRRLALEELLVLQVGLARRRREREDDVARALPPPGELVQALRAALPFRLTAGQEQAISELDADLAARGADGAPPPGRRRLGEDRRRALRTASCRRGRLPRGAHGAHGDARRAALPHRRVVLHAARGHLRPADELGRQARSRACGRRGRRRRHARPHPGGRRSRPACGGRRRRAASLRRRAAQGALRRARGRTRST